jgi:Cu/Ag efflux protein CusF
MRRIREAGAIVALAAGLVLAACGGASEGEGRGVVRGVDAGKSQVTLEHGEIPGMMKAMTMTFDVEDPALLSGLEKGDQVGFRLRYADGSYTVIAIDAESS